MVEQLTTQEIATFKRDGYIIKKRCLDPHLLSRARDRLWSGNTSATLRRDPPSWVAGVGFADEDQSSDASGLNDRSSKYSWRLRELSGDRDMLDLLPRRVWPWLQQLVGQELVEPVCTSDAHDLDPRGTRLRGWNFYGGKELRGAYCVLPQERAANSPSLLEAARAGVHQDPPPKHLVVSALLEAVPRGGGGMAVFPGSHKLLFEQDRASLDMLATVDLHLPHQQDGAGGSVLNARFRPAFERCQRILRGEHVDSQQPDGAPTSMLQPVEFCGDAGDVMLWHGRLFHSATPNFAPGQIRQMVLYDCVAKSTAERYYRQYERGPRPSMPPNIREMHGLQLGPVALRTRTPGIPSGASAIDASVEDDQLFWWEWSREVRETATAEFECQQGSHARL
eukprot:COSAG05_NODE_2287_length_3273_cov_132.259609_2_plen_394_part_00